MKRRFKKEYISVDINQLWEEFPHSYYYCVGGALCLFLAKHGHPNVQADSFPSHLELAEALWSVVPRLSFDDAMEAARWIIEANDSSQYELARGLLESVLRSETGN